MYKNLGFSSLSKDAPINPLRLMIQDELEGLQVDVEDICSKSDLSSEVVLNLCNPSYLHYKVNNEDFKKACPTFNIDYKTIPIQHTSWMYTSESWGNPLARIIRDKLSFFNISDGHLSTSTGISLIRLYAYYRQENTHCKIYRNDFASICMILRLPFCTLEKLHSKYILIDLSKTKDINPLRLALCNKRRELRLSCFATMDKSGVPIRVIQALAHSSKLHRKMDRPMFLSLCDVLNLDPYDLERSHPSWLLDERILDNRTGEVKPIGFAASDDIPTIGSW